MTSFDQWRAAWRERLTCDLSIDATACRLGMIISIFVNRESEDAWPAQTTLAEKIGLSDRQVRTLLSRLVDAGYLECDSGTGRGHSSRYRLALPEANKSGSRLPPLDAETRKPTSAFVAVKVEVQRQERWKSTSDKGGSPLPTNPFDKNPSDRTLLNAARARGQPTRSSPLPENWTPVERHYAKAAELGIDCERQAETFRAHALTHDRQCVRWDSAFDNWLLKSPTIRGDQARDARARGSRESAVDVATEIFNSRGRA